MSNININLIITIICVGIIFFVYFLPTLDKEYIKDVVNTKEKFDNINIPHIDQNICSRQCCKFTQWPIPFNVKDPNINTDKYIGSNFMCNNGQNGGGCVCYTKDNNDYLANHGQTNTNTVGFNLDGTNNYF
jgi:hypothetical protein